MKSITVLLSILLVFLVSAITIGQNSNDLMTKVANQVTLVQESKSADDIYIIKSRIDKLSAEAKSVNEKKIIRDAYLLMSDKFAAFSHYKSGALVYLMYMDLSEQLHKQEVQAVKDSIQTLRMSIVPEGQSTSAVDEGSSGNDLVDAQNEPTSGIGANNQGPNVAGQPSSGTNVNWMIGLALAVMAMLFVFGMQRKQISAIKTLLEKEQTDLKHLFRISANVSMLSGAIRYAREFSAHCAAVLSDLIEITNQNKSDSKVDHSKASQAVNVFKRISSGDNRSL